MAFTHVPVLLEEVSGLLLPHPGGLYVDATVGGGGHSLEICRHLGSTGVLVGLDRDPVALTTAAANLSAYREQVILIQGNFRHLDRLLAERGLGPADGVLLDLGVSSGQLDVPQRGFSYQHDAPLDMRMDPGQPLSARDLVNNLPVDELAALISRYGEERWAGAIARRVAQARQKRPIETTGQLAEIVKAAIPAAARRSGPHPARRTFQALRLAVNGELDALREGLEAALRVLKPGGRLVVISFHSLEDRVVKQAFMEKSRGCICPPGSPVCRCHHRPEVRLLVKKPLRPTAAEEARNRRARSARLRAVEKLGSKA